MDDSDQSDYEDAEKKVQKEKENTTTPSIPIIIEEEKKKEEIVEVKPKTVKEEIVEVKPETVKEEKEIVKCKAASNSNVNNDKLQITGIEEEQKKLFQLIEEANKNMLDKDGNLKKPTVSSKRPPGRPRPNNVPKDARRPVVVRSKIGFSVPTKTNSSVIGSSSEINRVPSVIRAGHGIPTSRGLQTMPGFGATTLAF